MSVFFCFGFISGISGYAIPRYAIDGHMNGVCVCLCSRCKEAHTHNCTVLPEIQVIQRAQCDDYCYYHMMHLLQNRRNERITQRTCILLTVAVIFLLSSWDYYSFFLRFWLAIINDGKRPRRTLVGRSVSWWVGLLANCCKCWCHTLV